MAPSGVAISRLGEPAMSKTAKILTAAVFLIAVVVILTDDAPRYDYQPDPAPPVVHANQPDPEPMTLAAAPPPAKPALPVGQFRVEKGNWIACQSKEDKSKITGYIVDQDKQAYERFLVPRILNGQCTVFEGGEVVYLEDTAIFSGLMKIRKRGETDAYWTNIEARASS